MALYSDVFQNPLGAGIDNAFALARGNVKFFCERFKTDTVNQTTAHNRSVTLCVSSVDMFINEMFQL